MKKIELKKLVEIIVIYCTVHGLSITPLKLQKLLYYIQAWHITKFEKENLFDELPQAWVNGPVYRSVYDTFKVNFFRNEKIHLADYNENVENIFSDEMKELDLSNQQKNLINSVLKFYAPQTDGTLVLKTHSDKPWNEAREGLNSFERSTNYITVDSMYNFYSGLIA